MSEEKEKEEQQRPMKYDVRIYPVTSDKVNGVKANASVNINGCFAVTNIRIVEGTKGLFVSMPSFKGREGRYQDICFPCTKEAKMDFDRAVISAYEQKMAPKQTGPKTQKQADMSQLEN